MEQRITRAKARIAARPSVFEAPDAAQRAERVADVMAMLYLGALHPRPNRTFGTRGGAARLNLDHT